VRGRGIESQPRTALELAQLVHFPAHVPEAGEGFHVGGGEPIGQVLQTPQWCVHVRQAVPTSVRDAAALREELGAEAVLLAGDREHLRRHGRRRRRRPRYSEVLGVGGEGRRQLLPLAQLGRWAQALFQHGQQADTVVQRSLGGAIER
jgi:hypothetical protein